MLPGDILLQKLVFLAEHGVVTPKVLHDFAMLGQQVSDSFLVSNFHFVNREIFILGIGLHTLLLG